MIWYNMNPFIKFEDLTIGDIIFSESERQRYKVKDIKENSIVALYPFTDPKKKRYTNLNKDYINTSFFRISKPKCSQ